MDNLKKYLAILLKYQFWILCGVILLVAVVCWWFATAGVATRFKARKAKLDSLFKDVVVAKGHPNQNVISKIQEQDKALKQNVFNAWEILYREQREKNQFPKVLGEDFKSQFNNVNLSRKEELPLEYRARYQNFILQHLQTLPKEIDARRLIDETKQERDRSNRPDDALHEEEWTGVVDWNESDRQAIEKRFEWQQTPSTMAVVIAQEDLWVYETLLRAIKNANEGAARATAVVKRIESLKIGADAVAAWRAAEEAVVRIPSAGQPNPSSEIHGGPGEAGEGRERQTLMDFRYVDDKGQALPSIPDYPFANHPNKEFKMLPIHMSLVMDQRRLPKLLVECANSNMPIEVRRVRLLKTIGGVLELGDDASRPVSVGPTSSSGSRGGSEQSGGDGKSDVSPMDVPIEIQGVIYIYNPPDRERLGIAPATPDSPAGKPATPAPSAKP
ncbi:MAG: hypothetical protein ABFC77_12130 [Thermoguttaceae bacterium]